MNQSSWLQGVGLGLAIAGLGVGALGRSEVWAQANPSSYNCLSREVFTPEKQQWCDRWQTLKTGTYLIPVGFEATPDLVPVTLVDGQYQDPEGRFAVALATEPNWYAFGDMTGGGQADAALILGVQSGQSTALATYLAAVMDVDSSAQALAPVVLGERIMLNGPLTIDNQRITVPQLTQTEVINRAFVVADGQLSELAQWPTPERIQGEVADSTLVFSQTNTYALRLFTRGEQPYLNLFNRQTRRQELNGVRAVAVSSVEGTVYTYGGSPSAGRPSVRVSLTPDNRQTLEVNNQVQRNFATVSGTVTYLPRMALPENAVVEVSLVDVSRADAPAITLASQSIVTGGRQVPIPFELVYAPNQIDQRFSYAVQARITVDGQLRFINTTRFPVITQGHPSQVEVRVEPVGR